MFRTDMGCLKDVERRVGCIRQADEARKLQPGATVFGGYSDPWKLSGFCC